MNISGTAKRFDFARAVTLTERRCGGGSLPKRRQRIWLQGGEVF